MKRAKVTIQAPTEVKDAEGITTQTFGAIGEVEGVMLPYGSERALRDYGYAGNVRFRFFYKGQHPDLKAGNQLLFNGQELPIVYVADYVKAMDVLLNTHGSSSFGVGV